jgi:phosphoacetylglucosamine mutase
VKLVDPRGEMLESSWEAHATVFANAPNSGVFVAAVDELVKTAKIDLSKPARVVYARDTRPTGLELVAALKDGLEAMEAEYRNAGITTTPVLHYLVRTINTKDTKDSYGEDTEEGYLTKLSSAFKKLLVGRTYTRMYVAKF